MAYPWNMSAAQRSMYVVPIREANDARKGDPLDPNNLVVDTTHFFRHGDPRHFHLHYANVKHALRYFASEGWKLRYQGRMHEWPNF